MFVKAPPLYMAALAFTAYGVHWFAIGWNRLRQADPRAQVGMTVAFTLISVLGIIVFFKAGDYQVGGVFIGLTCVYVTDFFVSYQVKPAGRAGKPEREGARLLPPRHRAVALLPHVRGRAGFHGEVDAAVLSPR